MYRFETLTTIVRCGVVAIIRSDDGEHALHAAREVLDAGMEVVEIALTTPDGLEAIRALRRDRPDAVVGAGTVLDGATARLAVDAGARLLVSPNVSREVIETGHRYGVAVIPGVQTSTELEQALSLGADAVKVFPATSLGIDWLRAIRPVFPEAPLVPTGGIGPDTVTSWVEAGAVAVGLGSALTRPGPTSVAERVQAVREAVAAARHQGPTRR